MLFRNTFFFQFYIYLAWEKETTIACFSHSWQLRAKDMQDMQGKAEMIRQTFSSWMLTTNKAMNVLQKSPLIEIKFFGGAEKIQAQVDSSIFISQLHHQPKTSKDKQWLNTEHPCPPPPPPGGQVRNYICCRTKRLFKLWLIEADGWLTSRPK